MKSFKRFSAMLMALILLASLGACGTKPAKTNEKDVVSVPESVIAHNQREAVTETEALELGSPAVTEFSGQLHPSLDNKESIVEACVQNDRIYFLTRERNDASGSTDSRIYAMEPDGADQTLILSNANTLPEASAEMFYLQIGIVSFCVCEDGSVWYAESSDMISSMRHIVHADASGTVLAEFTCDGASMLLPLSDGGAAVFADALNVLDSDGQTRFSIRPDDGWWEDAAVLDDGSVAVLFRDYNTGTCHLKRLDMELEELVTVMEMTAKNMKLAGGSWDALWLYGGNVSVWEPENDTLTEKLSFSGCGLNYANIRDVDLLSGNCLLVSERNLTVDSEDLSLYVLPTDGSARNGDKTVLRLAGLGIPYSLLEAVLAFNRTNGEYTIEIEDYYNYRTADDYDAGRDRLLYEIGTGDLPDIIYFGNDLSVEDMAKKGYLADIGALLDADPSIDRSELMENILDAAEIGGTLYSMPVCYYVETVLGRSDIIGTDPCTIENVRAWIEQNPEEEVFHGVTRDLVLQRLVWANADTLVDMDAGTCRFDGGEYAAFLEMAVRLPAIFTTEYIDQVSDVGLFIPVYATTLSTLAGGVAIGGYTITGYPGADGGKTILSPEPELGISANAADMDGCMALLLYLLSRQVQEEMNGFDGISVRRDVFDETVAELYQKCEEGLYAEEMVEASAAAAASDGVLLRPGSMVSRLSAIAVEEAQGFFLGDKTAEEAAEKTQSRASIYLAEQG